MPAELLGGGMIIVVVGVAIICGTVMPVGIRRVGIGMGVGVGLTEERIGDGMSTACIRLRKGRETRPINTKIQITIKPIKRYTFIFRFLFTLYSLLYLWSHCNNLLLCSMS